jgi:tetratricopeptide (TPR) repeat protein
MLRPFEELSPNAANFLRLLSFFNPSSISIEMLRTGLAGTELWRVKLWPAPLGDLFGRPKETFEKIRAELESVSVIQKLGSGDDSKPVLRFHNLYQLLIRATMIPMNEVTYWLEAAMLLLVGTIKKEPTFHSGWETPETYRPHVVSLLRQMMAVPDRVHQQRFSHVLYDLSIYLRENGDYTAARDALTLAFNSAANDSVLGPEHSETLRIQVERAEVHQMLGQYTIAEAEYKDVLSTQKKTLSKTHPEKLSTQQKLFSLGNVSGTYEKVVESCKAIERLMKRATPLELSYTKEQHAVALLHLGQDHAAERLLDEIRESRERSLGHDHPQTVNCLQHLSLVYRIQERYKEAEDLCRQILKEFEKTHGPAHLKTIHAKIQLAYILIYSDRPEETKDLLTPHTLLLHLGPENPHTLQAQGCLAHALERKCHFPEAAALYEEVHQQYEAQHGTPHPLTLRALRDLARIKGLLGKAEEARGLFSLALNGYTENFGRGHPDTMECLQDYAGFLMRGGGYVEALGLLEEVLLGRRKLFRRGHPDIVVSEKAVDECVRCVGKIEGSGGT